MKRVICLLFLGALFLPAVSLKAEVLDKAAVKESASQSASKLEQILRNQQEIIRQLGEIKAEMQTLKMRISSH